MAGVGAGGGRGRPGWWVGGQAGVCGGGRLVAAEGREGLAEVVDREQELAPGTWRVQTAGRMGV